MPDNLTSYGANEAANYGHRPLVSMTYEEFKEAVDDEFYREWARLARIPLCKEIMDER